MARLRWSSRACGSSGAASWIEAYFHTQKIREGALLDDIQIIEALEQRDPDAARAAMHHHLARVEREFQRQWDVIVPGEPGKTGGRRITAIRKRNITTQSAT